MCTCVCVCVCVVCVCAYASIVPLLVCACILINTFLAVFPAATDQEIEAFWEIIHSVVDAVTRDDRAKSSNKSTSSETVHGTLLPC